MASSSSSTSLLYACISHNTTILTEHTTSASSATSSLPALILPKITHATPQKLTYTHSNFYIHYMACAPSEFGPSAPSAGGLTFLAIADTSLGRRIPFGFLVTLQKKFFDTYPPESTDFASLPAYGCASFNATLRQLMQHQGGTQAGQNDALHAAQAEIDNVREIMTENIERVLERGERIDLLVDKTDRLGSNARDFRVRSRGLRRRMWWKNVKLMVLLVLVCVFLVYLFVGFGCGLPAWGRCLRH
ncbi:vesicle-associated membrane protein-like protein [Westerdykella ornata]|uniref:Synaptobrevin homolog YKT6 n=1 Tax=Westerdykella ornata TaxID=318751 RepID=A0A6A6JR01_WESOR|nr:vesicle-associated membrane protein-like protein [Westerdykella ornata]KAF2277389.1 vesicle-associated membrane protein-like protein [Westerdykella ornata]